MSSANTISIRLEVQGTPQVLSQLKSVLTGVNGLQTGLSQAKASMTSGFNLGPLQGLGNAIGQAEQKVSSLKAKLTTLGQEVGKNGAAFGVATASVWGIYNAYDSLVKVEIRAHQAQTRVMTTTTSLATMENRLQEARVKGNLTAEEMAILEDKITNTKARLAVAQERSADLQGDVNEAWGAFASQIGPQVVAAAGSIAQLVTNLKGSLTGVIPGIKNFVNGIGQSVFGMNQARVSSLTLSPALGGIGPAGAVAATGVRALSGAIKGLLIGTGIGALVVGVGFLIEALGLFNTATATTAEETVDNFDAAAEGPVQYAGATKTAMDQSIALIQKYGSDVAKSMGDASASYVESVMKQLEADKLAAEVREENAKAVHDSLQKEIDIYDAKFKAQDRNNLITGEEEKRWKELIPLRNKAATELEFNAKQADNFNNQLVKLDPILTNIKEKEAVVTEQHRLLTTGTKELQAAWSNSYASMDKEVDNWLAQNKEQIVGIGDQERAMTTLAKPWAAHTFGKELNTAATKKLNDAIKALLPDQEKEAKTLEKESEQVADLALKLQELEKKYGIDLPDSLATSEESLQAIQTQLEDNKQAVEDFLAATEAIRDISGLEKAFNLKIDAEEDVKDFIKDLPKETRKKIKLQIASESNLKEVKDIFRILAPGLFQTGGFDAQGNPIIKINLRPGINPTDIANYADSMIKTIEDHWGKGAMGKKGVAGDPFMASIIEDLKSADTQQEMVDVFVKLGIIGQDALVGTAATTGTKYADALKKSIETFDPLNILGGKKPEGITTFDKNGNPINTPVGTGASDSQIKDQTALQVALQKTQTALANLATQGANSLSILAKASSIQIKGFINNLKVGEVAAQKFQTGVANLANQGANSLSILAKASSTQMNGLKKNLSVGEVAAQKLQTGLANLANQGAKSLSALAHASSTQMNGFVNNIEEGTKAVEGLKDAIAGLKNKTVHIGLTGPGVKFLATGFHGIVDKPTIMVVGEAGAERVDVSPVIGGRGTTSLETDRNVRIEPVGKIQTDSRLQREIIKESGGMMPSVIQLVSYTYLFPNSEAYKKSIQQFSLDNTGMFPSA